MDPKEQSRLVELARESRILILNMLTKAGSGHTGGSLSVVEILAYLYFHKMRLRPSEPSWPDRDRLVLSKGHAAPALYTMLAMRGFIPKDVLFRLRRVDGSLQGHPDMLRTPGVDASTGSLGQGLSIACGMALGLRLSSSDSKVYAILGDGEIQEGQIWEAAMSAAHYKLKNLVAFIDANQLQIDGRVQDVMNVEPIAAKWESFGWNVQEIDGHDFAQIDEAIAAAEARDGDKPNMIVARTTKGKGVSFIEGKVGFHGVTPNMDELRAAMKELGGSVLLEGKS
ncbi:transketolase [bacterium]|nr:transketolase [bacterium]